MHGLGFNQPIKSIKIVYKVSPIIIVTQQQVLFAGGSSVPFPLVVSGEAPFPQQPPAFLGGPFPQQPLVGSHD